MHDFRRVPWTGREVRSRRAFRTFPSSPTAYARRPRGGPRGPRPADRRRGPGRDRRPRAAPAGLDDGDQPDRDPRARPRWPSTTSSTAWPPSPAPAGARDHVGCSTSAAAAASRASRSPRRCPPDRALLVDSVGQEGRLPGDRDRGRPGSGARVAAEAVRAEALARDARDREAWPAVTARARSPSLAELVEVGLPLVAPGGVLVAWKRLPAGRGARGGGARARGPASRPAGGRRPAACRASRPTASSSSERAGPIDARYPRDPGERRQRPL